MARLSSTRKGNSEAPDRRVSGLRAGRIAVSILVAALAAWLAALGAFKFIPPTMLADYAFLTTLSPSAVFILLLVAPYLPKIGKKYKRFIDLLLLGIAWVVLQAYEVVYLARRRRRRFLRVLQVGAPLGIACFVVLTWRIGAMLETTRHDAELSRRAWGTMILLVCDRGITTIAQKDYEEWRELVLRIRKKSGPRYGTLCLVHQAFSELYDPQPPDNPRLLDSGEFLVRCTEALSDLAPHDNAHPAIFYLLKARLRLVASQNGVHSQEVHEADELLNKGFMLLDATSQDDDDVRIRVAYLTYLGVVSKLKAQWLDRSRAQTNPDNSHTQPTITEDRTYLLAEAYRYYRKAGLLLDQAPLADPRVRLDNNRIDWLLFVLDLKLDPSRCETVAIGNLPAAARQELGRIHNPNARVKRLKQLRDEIRRTCPQQRFPQIAVTIAQAECLLARALQDRATQFNAQPASSQPSTIDPEAYEMLQSALYRIEFSLPMIDEREIFEHPRQFYFSALMDLDAGIAKQFRALQEEARGTRP